MFVDMFVDLFACCNSLSAVRCSYELQLKANADGDADCGVLSIQAKLQKIDPKPQQFVDYLAFKMIQKESEQAAAAALDEAELPAASAASEASTAKKEKKDEKEYTPQSQLGWTFKTTFCIDFTASNGSAVQDGTPHNLKLGSTIYQRIMKNIGSVLQQNLSYDVEKYPVGSFRAFGFGARFKNGLLSNCFSLTGSEAEEKLDMHDVDKVEKAYHRALKSIFLSGPPRYTQCITRVLTTIKNAQKLKQNEQTYHIVVLATCGHPDSEIDRVEFQAALQEASSFPISVVVVGVNQNLDPAPAVPEPEEAPAETQGKPKREAEAGKAEQATGPGGWLDCFEANLKSYATAAPHRNIVHFVQYQETADFLEVSFLCLFVVHIFVYLLFRFSPLSLIF
eukprot:m.250265 g.250265  ORF g.250265 m.250265 type:complete len:394 (-) comp15433_c0_seq21:147-1328(-)